MRFRRVLFCVIVCCVCLSGCVGKIRKVDVVRIGEVQVHDIKQNSLSCLVSVDVRNSHSMKVKMKDLSFQMGITRGPVGSGQIEKEMEIDSDTVKNIQIPLFVEYKNFSQNDFEALFGSFIPYHITGTFELKKPIHKKEVEVDSTGRIKAPERMKVQMQDDSFLNLVSFEPSGLNQIKLLSGHGTVGLKIRNPFGFDIGFYSFKYRFESGGKTVAEGFLTEPKMLSPGMNRMDLPVEVHPLAGIREAIGTILDMQLHQMNMIGTLVLQCGVRKLYIDLSYERTPKRSVAPASRRPGFRMQQVNNTGAKAFP